jgi:hypothetical protein
MGMEFGRLEWRSASDGGYSWGTSGSRLTSWYLDSFKYIQGASTQPWQSWRKWKQILTKSDSLVALFTNTPIHDTRRTAGKGKEFN